MMSTPLHVMVWFGSGELQTYERALKLGEVVRSTTRRLPTMAAVSVDAELISRTRMHLEPEGRVKERYGSAAEPSAMAFGCRLQKKRDVQTAREVIFGEILKCMWQLILS